MSKKKTSKTAVVTDKPDTTSLAEFFPAKRAARTQAKPVVPMIAGKAAMQKTAKPAADASKVKMSTVGKTKSKAKPGKRTGMSGLDAAAKVLADSAKPLTSQEIVEAMTSKGLWKSSGKTPHATIYAAVIREIAKKGSSGRFRKTDRGHFTVAKGVK